MAKMTDESARKMFAPYLKGEELTHWAYGVKQPNMLLIMVLIAMGILPGVIAVVLLTRNYMVGWTGNRLIVLQVDAKISKIKQAAEYDLNQLKSMQSTSSTGTIFTTIKIKDAEKPFVAKFHRAYSKSNRPNAMAIGEALSALSA